MEHQTDEPLMQHLAVLQASIEQALGQQEALFAALASALRTFDPASPAAAQIRGDIGQWLALAAQPESRTPAAALQAMETTARHLTDALLPRPTSAH